MTAVLEARRLTKIFPRPQGELRVLDGCDLALAAGDSVSVVGPSGAGKSTLLNLLGGLDRCDGGEIRHAGQILPQKECAALADWRNRTLGFVFQFHFLLPDFSARENLLIPVRIAGGDEVEAVARADALLDDLGLADRADHLPGELSGGEQQRVAVGRAFMNRPRIVLADEPFGNLDRVRSEALGQLLFEWAARQGTALVVVTHDRDLARRADRVLQLEAGRLRDLADVVPEAEAGRPEGS